MVVLMILLIVLVLWGVICIVWCSIFVLRLCWLVISWMVVLRLLFVSKWSRLLMFLNECWLK